MNYIIFAILLVPQKNIKHGLLQFENGKHM